MITDGQVEEAYARLFAIYQHEVQRVGGPYQSDIGRFLACVLLKRELAHQREMEVLRDQIAGRHGSQPRAADDDGTGLRCGQCGKTLRLG